VIYIVIGVLGFLVAVAFDWVSLKRLPAATKQLVGLLSVGLLTYSTVMVCLTPEKFDFPFFAVPLGILLLLVSLFLLVYSLFIEIPFGSTYSSKGTSNKLTTTGTYALTRHPGVLWLALFYVALILLFPSATMIIATIVWIIMDIIWVLLEDKVFFPRMFPDHSSYQKQTPFLIPNRKSFSACLRTIRAAKREAHKSPR